MIDFSNYLNEYSFDYYFVFSNTLDKKTWGDKAAALSFLKRFFIAEKEYTEKWEGIKNLIFSINDSENKFSDYYSVNSIPGGVLFEKSEFERLTKCLSSLGEKYLIIIQNDSSELEDKPLFKLKIPIITKWDELMGGNFISTVLFEMPSNEYYVFSESATWGKYSANDQDVPYELIGYKKEVSKEIKQVYNI